jgi:SRSO17 transposase
VIAQFFTTDHVDLSPQARTYIAGLLTRCPRKNMERMAEEIPGAVFQNLQYFISASRWEYSPLWKWIGERAAKLLGGGVENMLLIDESGFSKKGVKSAGVAREYNGRVGKVDNCQVGVFSALSFGSRATLTGARLYLPEDWTEDSERCEAAKVPEAERRFRTKPELAWELIEQMATDGIPFGWVGMDAVYGRDQGPLLKISGMGKKFMADVDHDQKVWTVMPESQVRPENVTEDGAVFVESLWKSGKSAARKINLRDGENGRVVVRFWAQRVWIWPQTSEIPMGGCPMKLAGPPPQAPPDLVRWQESHPLHPARGTARHPGGPQWPCPLPGTRRQVRKACCRRNPPAHG